MGFSKKNLTYVHFDNRRVDIMGNIFEANKFKFPEPYISKYIIPSVGEDVFNGTHRISGSCVLYKQLRVPNTKLKKLEIIGAEGWDTFFSEPGICQYLLPKKLDLPITKCDSELKPQWNPIRPFTGHGFLAGGTAAIVQHLYLTEEVEPHNGHLMVFYGDEGNIYCRYQFNETKNQWEEVERFDTWINSKLTKIPPNSWKSLVKSLMKIEENNAMVLSTFANLFLLTHWNIIGKLSSDNSMLISTQDLEGKSYLLAFTSTEHVKQYIDRIRELKNNDYPSVFG